MNADTAWTENVYITGNVTVGAGKTLTVPSGVVVTFVPTDQDGDGAGDWNLNRQDGTLRAVGTEQNPVLFTVLGTMPALGGYSAVEGSGGSGTTDLSWTVFEKGRTNLRASAGAVTLTDVTTRNAVEQGLSITGGATASITRLTAESNGKNGVYLQGSGARTLNYLTAQNNLAWGVYLDGASGATNAVTNSTLKSNTLGGLYTTNSKCAIGHSNITYNGYGIRADGTSSGAITANNIKYNDFEGVMLAFSGSGNPSCTVNGNNLFGNAALKGGIVEAPALSASSSGSSSGTYNSSLFSAGTEIIEFVKAGYSESDYDYYNYENGYIIGKPGDVEITHWTYSASTAWTNIAGWNATGVLARVTDNTSSYYGTATIDKVFYHKSTAEPARNIEMSVVIPSGSIDAKGNYWGVFGSDVNARIVLAESGTVDSQGATSSSIAGCGPQ